MQPAFRFVPRQALGAGPAPAVLCLAFVADARPTAAQRNGALSAPRLPMAPLENLPTEKETAPDAW